jgi:hypothetical protein
MLNLKWTLTAVTLAASFAGIASAQSEHYRGSFTLPVEARFGNVVLQPGSYKIATLEGAKGLRITGETGNVALLAAGYDVEPGTAKARMILVESGGMYTLQRFESGSMGKALNFVVEKSPRGAVERAAVKSTIEVGLQ